MLQSKCWDEWGTSGRLGYAWVPLTNYKGNCSTSLYFTLRLCYSSMVLLHSIWLYTTLPRLSLILLYSTAFYHGSMAPDYTWLYITLPWPHFTLLPSTIILLHFTWLYVTIFDYTLLYHGFTSVYLTLHYSAIALLPSTWLPSTWLCSRIKFMLSDIELWKNSVESRRVK